MPKQSSKTKKDHQIMGDLFGSTEHDVLIIWSFIYPFKRQTIDTFSNQLVEIG